MHCKNWNEIIWVNIFLSSLILIVNNLTKVILRVKNHLHIIFGKLILFIFLPYGDFTVGSPLENIVRHIIIVFVNHEIPDSNDSRIEFGLCLNIQNM